MGIDLTKLETLTPEQVKSVQFDTGVLVRDFDLANFRQTLLQGQVACVTKDSFSVNVNRETVNVLADLNGVHFDYLEGMVTSKITASVSFTLASMSLNDLALALGSAAVSGDCVTAKFEITAADFKNIALILPVLDGGFVIAELPLAYSTGGLSVSANKAAVGGLNVTMTGYRTLADKTVEPVRLYRIAAPESDSSDSSDSEGDGE